ncbi:MAG: hypothetical protein CM15mV2_1210 [uncultured marine virus]|nr:MAG: hypothetical protein CM15mV2_1210 [uncultured marine virus]
MIILTGSDGFIGKHFKNSLESGQQLILPVDVDNAFNFLEQFNRWDEVSMIIHQGALSSTTNINIDAIYKYNIVFSIELFKKQSNIRSQSSMLVQHQYMAHKKIK